MSTGARSARASIARGAAGDRQTVATATRTYATDWLGGELGTCEGLSECVGLDDDDDGWLGDGGWLGGRDGLTVAVAVGDASGRWLVPQPLPSIAATIATSIQPVERNRRWPRIIASPVGLHQSKACIARGEGPLRELSDGRP